MGKPSGPARCARRRRPGQRLVAVTSCDRAGAVAPLAGHRCRRGQRSRPAEPLPWRLGGAERFLRRRKHRPAVQQSSPGGTRSRWGRFVTAGRTAQAAGIRNCRRAAGPGSPNGPQLDGGRSARRRCNAPCCNRHAARRQRCHASVCQQRRRDRRRCLWPEACGLWPRALEVRWHGGRHAPRCRSASRPGIFESAGLDSARRASVVQCCGHRHHVGAAGGCLRRSSAERRVCRVRFPGREAVRRSLPRHMAAGCRASRPGRLTLSDAGKRRHWGSGRQHAADAVGSGCSIARRQGGRVRGVSADGLGAQSRIRLPRRVSLGHNGGGPRGLWKGQS